MRPGLFAATVAPSSVPTRPATQRRSRERSATGSRSSGRSWQAPEPGYAESQLQREEQQGRAQQEQIQLAILAALPDSHIHPLGPIDLLHDVAERLGICRVIV